MTNLMKFIVFALLVASVCAVPLSRPADSEALISETEPKADELRGELRTEERERAEAHEAAADDKTEARELKAEEESKERAEELKSDEEEPKEKAEELKSEEEEPKEKAEELKTDEESKERAEELKSEEKERERRQSEEREKAEELKAEEKAEELKSEEVKADELKADVKAEELKADKLETEAKAEELKAEVKAEELKADESEKAEPSKVDERAEEEAQELRAEESKAEEKAEMLKGEEEKAEEKAEHLKAEEKETKERAEELKSEEEEPKEKAEELKTEEESKEKAEELKSEEEEPKEKAEELKSDEESKERAEELKSDEEKEKERERRQSEKREKAEGEAQELKSEEESKERAEELKSEEEPKEKAEELKSEEEETKEKAEALESSEKTDGEAQELKSDEESKERAEELRSSEEAEEKRMRRAIEKAIEAEALQAEKEEEKSGMKAESLKKEEERMMMAEQPSMEALVGQDPSMIGSGAVNPCDVPEFKYYQPHPTEPAKYYQCDPWGTFVEKKCGEGLMWDRWQLRCQEEEKIVNMTSLLPTTIRRLSDFNCTIAKFGCKNGGECISNGQEFRCVCSGNFTGDMCEVRVTDFDLYSEIMNGNFSIEDYIRRIMKENVSLDLSYYEQYKEVLEPAVYERLIRYLEHYKNGLVRYDTLVNSLVEDVLGDIYPDADFLRTFNISQQSVITTIRLVPNLLSYARYSSERYQDVFVQYQRVLEQLWSFLNTTVPRLRTEAVRYTELTQFFLNGTIGEENWKVLNETVSRRFGGRNFFNDTVQGDSVVREAIKMDFESILERARTLCAKLAKFEKEVVGEWKKVPEFVYKTVAQTELPGAQEFIGIFEEIKEINMDIWSALVSYGFWFITNVFTTVPRV